MITLAEFDRDCRDCRGRYGVIASESSPPPLDWRCPSCERTGNEPELDDYEYALRNAVG
jgi:hypothetical protein